MVYRETKSISYLLILKRQSAESLPVGCFTLCHGASEDNCNPELASSAIAMLKVCIHDVIHSRRKTEKRLGTTQRSYSRRRPLRLVLKLATQAQAQTQYFTVKTALTLTCRTGGIFLRILGEQRWKRAEREGRARKKQRVIFFALFPRARLALCVRLAFASVRLKYAKKFHLFCRLPWHRHKHKHKD